MRDDAIYLGVVEDNDDNLYKLISEKKKIPKLAQRFAGISFFITEEQLSVLPLRFISGSRERSLEIFKLIIQNNKGTTSDAIAREAREIPLCLLHSQRYPKLLKV